MQQKWYTKFLWVSNDPKIFLFWFLFFELLEFVLKYPNNIKKSKNKYWGPQFNYSTNNLLPVDRTLNLASNSWLLLKSECYFQFLKPWRGILKRGENGSPHSYFLFTNIKSNEKFKFHVKKTRKYELKYTSEALIFLWSLGTFSLVK